jgi:hypothetical protein
MVYYGMRVYWWHMAAAKSNKDNQRIEEMCNLGT